MVGRLRGESAVGARDDVFPADELREPHQALGDQDRMLDDVARMADHPRNEHLALGERSEEHTSELQSPCNLVCRLLLEKKKKMQLNTVNTKTDSPIYSQAVIHALHPQRRTT